MIEGNSENQDFFAAMRKQRGARGDQRQRRKTVLGGPGAPSRPGPAAGWIFAFDVATNKVSTTLALSPGEGAGIWMGGQGVTADPQGFLYAMTGNGDFDADRNGAIRSSRSIHAAGGDTAATLKVVDHWTPWTDSVRTGQKDADPEPIRPERPHRSLMKPVGGSMNISMKGATLGAIINDRGKPIPLVFPNMATGSLVGRGLGLGGPGVHFRDRRVHRRGQGRHRLSD